MAGKVGGAHCPICKNPLETAEAAGEGADTAKRTHHPFCSRRCADIDLNRWLSGHYAIAGDPAAPEDIDPEDPDEDPTRH